mmetsp:Transcript_70763/g.156120  ORF Transcript_70763/g.156120 Transcript_70763/m.156120 type:complete len:104 (-) Transcript_70763:1160-1471(-)
MNVGASARIFIGQGQQPQTGQPAIDGIMAPFMGGPAQGPPFPMAVGPPAPRPPVPAFTGFPQPEQNLCSAEHALPQFVQVTVLPLRPPHGAAQGAAQPPQPGN